LRFFLFFVDFGVLARVAFGAGGAIFRGVTDALWRGEFLAGVGVGDGFDGRDGVDEGIAFNVLRGDLDAIEGEACAAGKRWRRVW